MRLEPETRHLCSSGAASIRDVSGAAAGAEAIELLLPLKHDGLRHIRGRSPAALCRICWSTFPSSTCLCSCSLLLPFKPKAPLPCRTDRPRYSPTGPTLAPRASFCSLLELLLMSMTNPSKAAESPWIQSAPLRFKRTTSPPSGQAHSPPCQQHQIVHYLLQPLFCSSCYPPTRLFVSLLLLSARPLWITAECLLSLRRAPLLPSAEP